MGLSIRKTVESLKHLRPDKADKLYDEAVRFGFVPKKWPDNTVMFIFPDGRMLGASNKDYKGQREDGSLNRMAYHAHLTVYHDFEELGAKDRNANNHPLLSPTLAIYYNIIVVAGGHMGGYVQIPNGVEPTREQLNRLRQFHQEGFQIDDYNTVPVFDTSIWDNNM